MADGVWIVNASPLIVLAKIGRLSLLQSLATDVLVPDAVARELLAGPPTDPARVAVAAGFGSRPAVREIPESVIEWSLGAGESSVIAECLATPGSTAVLDDAEARACAATLRIPLIGTLGVVARARTRELIPSAAAVFLELRGVGLFVDGRLEQALLRTLGEAS